MVFSIFLKTVIKSSFQKQESNMPLFFFLNNKVFLQEYSMKLKDTGRVPKLKLLRITTHERGNIEADAGFLKLEVDSMAI